MASLYLTGNQISDLAPVLSLRRLVSLYLDENDLHSIEGINQLKGLSTFSIRGNAVCDLAPLQGLEGLSWLFLDHNKIRDLGPLVEMVKRDKEQKFAPFLKIYLEGNPLAPNGQDQIAALKEAGARVHP
jgi:hypothetical protein